MATERNVMAAAAQYATRPADERYTSMADFIKAAEYDKSHSVERAKNLKDLRAVATEREVRLQSERGQAVLTHWSFGQLARTIGAPASYLRTLPPTIAADAINYGLQSSPVGTTINLLLKANGGAPIVRAATSETYGRVWDVEYADALKSTLIQDGSKWLDGIPTWDGPKGGLYRGDRDSFVLTVNGGSIVNDPSAGSGKGEMFRGLMLRNSEVGASSFYLDEFMFRKICGNHIIWGMVMGKQYRRRHIGQGTLRDIIREITRVAWNWANQSASRDEAIIKALISNELAATKEAVVDELRKIGATKEQAIEAYETAERSEKASPRSFWGLAQGLTRNSQMQGEAGVNAYMDERLSIDQIAAALLAKGAAKVAAA